MADGSLLRARARGRALALCLLLLAGTLLSVLGSAETSGQPAGQASVDAVMVQGVFGSLQAHAFYVKAIVAGATSVTAQWTGTFLNDTPLRLEESGQWTGFARQEALGHTVLLQIVGQDGNPRTLGPYPVMLTPTSKRADLTDSSRGLAAQSHVEQDGSSTLRFNSEKMVGVLRVPPGLSAVTQSLDQPGRLPLQMATAGLADTAGREIPGRFILQFNTPVNPEPDWFQKAVRQLWSTGLVKQILQEYPTTLHGVAIRAAPDAMAILADLPFVAHAWSDRTVHVNRENGVPAVGASATWARKDAATVNLKGRGITVAVIDTGIDYTHPDLGGCFGENCRVKGGRDFYSNDGDPFDDHGHGTHVAGIVAGNGTIDGVAPEANLLAYKVLGSNGGGSTSTVLAGMEAAVDPNGDGNTFDHADIASVSLGALATSLDDPFVQAIRAGTQAGVLFVVAAGNNGVGGLNTPGIAPDALTVAASCMDFQISPYSFCPTGISSFSSRGPGLGSTFKPDLAAPGVEINSTVPGARHARFSGTSMATPFVSGAAALLKQLHPTWGPPQLKSALMASSQDLGQSPFEQGAGQVHVDQALDAPYWTDTPGINFGLVNTNQANAALLLHGLALADLQISATGPFNATGAPMPGTQARADASSVQLLPGTTKTLNLTLSGLSNAWGSLHGALVLQAGSQQFHIPYTVEHWLHLNVTVKDPSGKLLVPDVVSLVSPDLKVKQSGSPAWDCRCPIASFKIAPGSYIAFAQGSQEGQTPFQLAQKIQVDASTSVALHEGDARLVTFASESINGTPLFGSLNWMLHIQVPNSSNEDYRTQWFLGWGTEWRRAGFNLFLSDLSDLGLNATLSARINNAVPTPALVADEDILNHIGTAKEVYVLGWNLDNPGPASPTRYAYNATTLAAIHQRFDFPGTNPNSGASHLGHLVHYDFHASRDDFFAYSYGIPVPAATNRITYVGGGTEYGYNGPSALSYYHGSPYAERMALGASLEIEPTFFQEPMPSGDHLAPGTQRTQSVGVAPYLPFAFRRDGSQLTIQGPYLASQGQAGFISHAPDGPSLLPQPQVQVQRGDSWSTWDTVPWTARPTRTQPWSVPWVDTPPTSGPYAVQIRLPTNYTAPSLVEATYSTPDIATASNPIPALLALHHGIRFTPGSSFAGTFTASSGAQATLQAFSDGVPTATTLQTLPDGSRAFEVSPTGQHLDLHFHLLDSTQSVWYNYTNAALAQQTPRLEFIAPPDSLVRGKITQISGRVLDEAGTPLDQMLVHGYVRTPEGQILQRSDMMTGAQLVGEVPGGWHFNVNVTRDWPSNLVLGIEVPGAGNIGSGHMELNRTVQHPNLVLGPDWGIDADGNGGFEAIGVPVHVQITNPGTYTLHAILTGTPNQPPIGALNLPISNTTQDLELRIPATALSALHLDGPYSLTIRLNDGATGVDRVDAHTQAYLATSFDLPDARLTGFTSDRGRDLNGDGALDEVQVSSGLELRHPGSYQLQVLLLDVDGQPFAGISRQFASTQSGNMTWNLHIPGSSLRDAPNSGPWGIQLTLLQSNATHTAWLGYTTWESQPYDPSQFSTQPVNYPPEITDLTLSPTHPTAVTGITATPTAMDQENDTITYTYEWRRNGAVQDDLHSESVPASRVAKGEAWTVTVIPMDATGQGDSVNATTAIQNLPPALTLSLTPANPVVGQDIHAQVASSDPDGDPLTVAYAWRLNGQPHNETTGDTASGTNDRVGDTWSVLATVSDPSGGQAQRQANVTVVNRAPSVSSAGIQPANPSPASNLTFAATASDPDGEPLTYSYAWKQNGTLQSDLATNQVPGTRVRSHDVWEGTMKVTDPHGATATSAVSVTVANQAPMLTIDLQPHSPVAGQALHVNVSAVDPDGDATTTMYAWSLNSQPQLDLSTADVPANRVQPTDVWEVTVQVQDSYGAGNQQARSVTIPNRAPDIAALTLQPNNPLAGSNLTAVVSASDPDGEILVYSYIWTRNGIAQPDLTTPTVAGARVHSLDAWQVTVVAQDPHGANDTKAATASIPNRPPILTLNLEPRNPEAGQALLANATAVEPDGDGVTISYRWSLNHELQADLTDALVPATRVHKGDLWEATVQAQDNHGAQMQQVRNVTIGNQAPLLTSLTLSPSNPSRGSTLQVAAHATDPEGDPITYRYQWSRNGVLQAAFVTSTVAGSLTVKGDTWSVSVTPNDSHSDGATQTVAVTIQNTPPTVAQASATPSTVTVGDNVQLHLASQDMDNDALTVVWTLPDGSRRNGADASVSFASVGTQTVQYSLSDGMATASGALAVTVTSPPSNPESSPPASNPEPEATPPPAPNPAPPAPIDPPPSITPTEPDAAPTESSPPMDTVPDAADVSPDDTVLNPADVYHETATRASPASGLVLIVVLGCATAIRNRGRRRLQ